MINQLYIERLSDGGYDVICNDLVATVIRDASPCGGIPSGITGAIEVLTQPLIDDCEYEDDAAGARVGYMGDGMVLLAYMGQRVIVPEFRLAGAVERLVGEGEHA